MLYRDELVRCTYQSHIIVGRTNQIKGVQPRRQGIDASQDLCVARIDERGRHSVSTDGTESKAGSEGVQSLSPTKAFI